MIVKLTKHRLEKAEFQGLLLFFFPAGPDSIYGDLHKHRNIVQLSEMFLAGGCSMIITVRKEK